MHSASSTNCSVTLDRLLHLFGFLCLSQDQNSTDTKRLFWEIINACNIFKSRPGKRKSTLNFSFYNFYLKICVFFHPHENFLSAFFLFFLKIPFLPYYWFLLLEFLLGIRISDTAFHMSFSFMFSTFIIFLNCCCSVAKLYPTLCNPMDCITAGFLVYSLILYFK